MTGKPKQLMVWLAMQEDDKFFEIKEYHEKRSLNANSYFYVLQNKLAQALKTGNDELHEQLIKRYADVTLITIPETENIKGIIKYYDIYNTGTIKGIPVIMYKAYKPSHEMTSKEFTRLLDGLISECKEVGINVMTPEELRRLEGYDI